MNIVNQTINLGGGKEISIETGKLAKQADGSVVVRMGETMILATAVANVDVRDGVDFMPLTVDYREKFASTGKFPGGFLKREARPSDEEILTMRLVDRALRPLFPDDYHANAGNASADVLRQTKYARCIGLLGCFSSIGCI